MLCDLSPVVVILSHLSVIIKCIFTVFCDLVVFCAITQNHRGVFMQFSLRFKQLCKERHITQKQALSNMGFHRNAVQSWTSGKPSAEALIKIAEYFEMSTDEVLGVDNKKTPTPEGERITKEDFYAAFEAADESTREAIRILLKVK